MKRRFTGLLLVFAMILTLLPAQAFAAGTAKPVDTANPFEDVAQGSWYYDAVQYVRVNGLFNGVNKTEFRPEGTMTRGMFVTVLGRMAGVNPDKYTGPSSFADVPENAYYTPYVAWASKYGVTEGTGDQKFSPDSFINRQQMAVFFVRYFETFGVNYETNATITTTPGDIDSAAPWARDAVLKLWRTGLLNGDGTDFNPSDNAARAQTAAICYRADEAVGTWYSEPGTASTRVKINPATGLPFGEGTGSDTPANPSGGSGSSGSGSGGGSYTVTFYDGTRVIDTLPAKKGEPLGAVPSVLKSSKAGAILEGYYTDSGFTTPFYAENPVTGNLSVYAKYASMGGAETLTPNSFAKMDQAPDVSFIIKKVSGNTSPVDAVTLLVKDGSDPVEISVVDNGNGTYKVFAPTGFNPGCSYELNLAEGWTFVHSDYPDADTIRTAAFSVKMAEVENLSMNEGIRYIKDTANINYTYMDKDGKSHSNIAELPSDADISGGGSFNYDDQAGALTPGDILCIYVGGKPDSGETEKTEEAIYAKVDSVNDTTVKFVSLKQEDQMKLYEIPDNFPIQVDALPDGNTGTVRINELDIDTYALMVNESDSATVEAAEAKLNVGDFVTLYLDADDEGVYFGRVTGVADDGTITYEKSSSQEIEESANLYKSIENTNVITPEEAEEIQRIVQAQVESSNFGEEAAYYLAEMATRTDGFRDSAGLLAIGADGQPMTDEELAAYADTMVLAESDDDNDGIKVKVQVITDQNKLHYGSKGVQIAVTVSAEFEAEGKDEGKIKFELSATFVQEVAVDPTVKGNLVYKKILKKKIPVPTGVQVNAIVDVKNYTAMSLRADIYTVAAEDKSTWNSFKGFLKDSSALGDIPGMPDALTNGIKTVGDALNEIEEIKAKIDKGLEDTKKLENDLNALWSAVETVGVNGLTRESYESACETLGKTNVAGELTDMLHIADEDISADYYDGLSDLMDAYAELLERETGWVQLVEAEMFDAHTPPQYGIMVGVAGTFVVRADVNIALGSNLEYEVGKRYNFWFRVGLFKPTSGSSTMDLIDEHFAFQFYVMGKLGLKAGVQLNIYAAIGSKDAISVGLTTELGPYLKLWGFFIYDYSKYRKANTTSWVSKDQMAGALYLEFGLYLMVDLEAKALFLNYSKDFVDEEFPLLSAGGKNYYYSAAYEPIDETDEIVVYNDGSMASPQSGCAVSMLLPEDTYALNYMDLTTGKQGSKALTFDNYTFKVSNPNFRVDNVGGKPVVSVISIPQDVRLMQCDLTVTYKYGKLAFSTYDMSTTVHLVWTSLTPEEYQQFYTASVVVPNGNGGMDAVWSKRVRKGQIFDLPAEDEVRRLLSWSDAKYTAGTGYGNQQTEGVTLVRNTQYVYNLDYKSYTITVNGIEDGSESQTFTAKYGEPFDFSALEKTGTNGPDKYTRFVGLKTTDGQIDLNRPADGKVTAATAVYVNETVTATFEFTGVVNEDITVKLRKGSTPDTSAVHAAVPDTLTITGYYPALGPIDGDTTYHVVCEEPKGEKAEITFETNGGVAVEPIKRPIGGVLGELPTTTKTGGYVLEGWYIDAELTTKATAGTQVTGDMTLYANWKEGASIAVTLNPVSGMLTGDTTLSVISGGIYGTLPTPERSGYHFLGWFTAQEGGTEVTAATPVTETENHTIYAHWRQLKMIPSTVFDFGAQETVTYNTQGHNAEYTFNAETGETYTADSFTISYIRKSDGFRGENTNEGASPVTAGTYNVTIRREADDTYDIFDQTYSNVLVIERAYRASNALTADDIVLGDNGLTYQKVGLTEKWTDLLSGSNQMQITYHVQSGSSTYNYNSEGVESALLYDFAPDTTCTITGVDIKGDINYKDTSISGLDKQFTTKPAPTKNLYDTRDDADKARMDKASQWLLDKVKAGETPIQVSSAADLACVTYLVDTKDISFSGITLQLTNDVDLSEYKWEPIGKINGDHAEYFEGTFEGVLKADGSNPVISGVYVSDRWNPNGFFGAIYRATIKNITLEDSYIGKGDDGGKVCSGGLVGRVRVLSKSIIENCESNAVVYGMKDWRVRIASNYTGTDALDMINCSGRSIR